MKRINRIGVKNELRKASELVFYKVNLMFNSILGILGILVCEQKRVSEIKGFGNVDACGNAFTLYKEFNQDLT